jgi:hypothetical protein
MFIVALQKKLEEYNNQQQLEGQNQQQKGQNQQQNKSEVQFASWQEIVLPGNGDIGIRKYVVWEETHQSDSLEALKISEKEFIVFTKSTGDEKNDKVYPFNQVVIHHYHEDSNLYTVNLTLTELLPKKLDINLGCTCYNDLLLPGFNCDHMMALVLFLRKRRELQHQQQQSGVKEEDKEYTAEFIHQPSILKTVPKELEA